MFVLLTLLCASCVSTNSKVHHLMVMCDPNNGNFGSHSKARKIDITMKNNEGLAWYKISDQARRGFCRLCGSGLFWELYQQDAIGIIAGSFDRPTDLKTVDHVFVEEKSDFYEITDDLQQFQASSNGKFDGDYYL